MDRQLLEGNTVVPESEKGKCKKIAIMEQIGRLLLQEGYITLEEKIKYDAVLKRL